MIVRRNIFWKLSWEFNKEQKYFIRLFVRTIDWLPFMRTYPRISSAIYRVGLQGHLCGIHVYIVYGMAQWYKVRKRLSANLCPPKCTHVVHQDRWIFKTQFSMFKHIFLCIGWCLSLVIIDIGTGFMAVRWHIYFLHVSTQRHCTTNDLWVGIK